MDTTTSRQTCMSSNPFEHHLRLKRPCSNCPFRLEGGIQLEPGRLDGIIRDLLADDRGTFQCHKVVYSSAGGTWDADGQYQPSGNEAMCAGAAAVLMKRGRPTISMRVAFAMGVAKPDQWDHFAEEVVD